MTVIELETNDEKMATDDLNHYIAFALNGKRSALNYLKTLWPECSWQTIKERLNTEGSVWYVWWMDGVRQHLANRRQKNAPD